MHTTLPITLNNFTKYNCKLEIDSSQIKKFKTHPLSTLEIKFNSILYLIIT